MGKKNCSIAGCNEIAKEQGLCTKHFTAALTHGVFFEHRHPLNAQHPCATAQA